MSLDRSRLSVKFSINRLRAQQADLVERQYPGDHPGPRKWLKLIEGLLDTADNQLYSSNNKPPDQALRHINDAAELCRNAYTYFNFLEGAGIDDLPYSVIQPLQRWFDDLKIDGDTFFRAKMDINYEVESIDEKHFKRIRNPSNALSNAIAAISWPIHRITVPKKAFSILPHFAIVAHEFGHLLYDKTSWNDDIANHFKKEEKNLIKRIRIRLSKSVLTKEDIKEYNKILARWCEELAADAFAVTLTGPAIFFAVSDFFQLFANSHGLSKAYPANEFRRGVLFKQMLYKKNSESFAEIFNEFTGQELTVKFNSELVSTPSSDELFTELSKNKDYTKTAAAIIAELNTSISEVVEVIYQNVRDYIQKNVPKSLYSAEIYRKDMKDHFEGMLNAIPPIESGNSLSERKSANFSSILNIGWAVLLTKLPELKLRTDEMEDFGAEKLERLHDLLLKAVELSEAKIIWEEVK